MFPGLHNFLIRKNMCNQQELKDLKWLNPQEYQRLKRLNYIKSFNKPAPNKCPECGGELKETPQNDEIICTKCGLITRASITYVAGLRIDLPYGLLLV